MTGRTSGLRRLARLLTVAALGVVLAVTTSQILTDSGLSWSWLYVSLAVAVLAALYSEVHAAGGQPGPAAGRRSVYLRQLRASVREMEIVGIVTQSEFVLQTKQVYVDVSLTRRPRHETAHEPYVGAVTAPAAVGERRTLASFLDGGADDARVLAVIGGPGTGKTTLVRSTALDLCATGWRRRRPLPVLLYLRDHKAVADQDPPSLPEVAASASWLHGRVPADWLAARLDRGGCVVLLDGLDEVADEADRSRVVAWVKRQIDRYPRNRYVLTSRPHGYHTNPLPTAEVVQVRRFTGEQISRFLHGWSYAIERRASESDDPHVRQEAARKADDLLERLRRQPALYDLAANPLLLTMIANVHRYRGQLPGSRAALYAEMCDVLLHRRAEVRDLANPTGLRGPQKERVMRHLALAMMRDRVRDIPADAAHRAIREPLRQVSRDVASETFLAEARKSGLLVEREHGVYAFAHLTLQEYLAAAQIGQRPLHVELLTRNVNDPWWRETTLLWAANADATPVITACLDAGTVHSLTLALDCGEEAAEADPDARAQLHALLASFTAQLDPSRRRLAAGVMATRSLLATISLGGDTTLCARPVPNALYALFADEQIYASGIHMPAPHPGDADDAPAVGMWSADAARFVSWLNDLFDDGPTYRLPTPDELADPAVDLVVDRSRHTIWAQAAGDPGPSLYARDGTPRSYTPDAVHIENHLSRDRHLTSYYLALVSLTLTDPRQALRFRLAFNRPLPTGPDLRLPELALSLMLIEKLLREGEHRALVALQRYARAAMVSDDMARDIVTAMGEFRVPGVPDDREFAPLLDHALILASSLIDGSPSDDVREFTARQLFSVPRIHRAFDFTETTSGVPGLEPWTAMQGFEALLATWEPSYWGHEPVELRRAFDAYLAGVLADAGRPPERPVPLTERLTEWITRRRIDIDPNTWEQARPLLGGVLGIVAPILDRTAPFDSHALACARIGLLGAIALLRRAVAHEPVQLLGETLHALIALQQRADGELQPNEVLLLVRE